MVNRSWRLGAEWREQRKNRDEIESKQNACNELKNSSDTGALKKVVLPESKVSQMRSPVAFSSLIGIEAVITP